MGMLYNGSSLGMKKCVFGKLGFDEVSNTWNGGRRTLHATAKFLTGTVRTYFDSQRY